MLAMVFQNDFDQSNIQNTPSIWSGLWAGWRDLVGLGENWPIKNKISWRPKQKDVP